jgi:Na+/H+-translocating membrane pyrophosphatase
MDDNPYLKILQERKQQMHRALESEFAISYCLLGLTIVCFALLFSPTFIFIIDAWLTRVLNVPLAIFALLSVVFGTLLAEVLNKTGKFHGTWKRPTLFSEGGVRLRFSGLWFYPPSKN